MTYPTTPDPSSISITSVMPSFVSQSQSLVRQTRTTNTQQWMIEMVYPPMTRAAFAPLWAFINSQQGGYGIFSFVPPEYNTTSGTADTETTCNVDNAGGYNPGESTISIDWSTGSETLKAGDFIKFDGHDKVYMLTSDASSSASITPPLLSSVNDNEQVIFDGVAFKVSLDKDTQSFQHKTHGLISYKVKLVESF